jgi:hypothetical protein
METIDLLSQNFSELRAENTEAHENILATVQKQNGRIGKLETWRWYLVALATGAIGIAIGSGLTSVSAITTLLKVVGAGAS